MNLKAVGSASEVVPSLDLSACDIIIVNWNAGAQLADCLVALSRTRQSHFSFRSVVIVDNNSTDDSLQLAESAPVSLPLVLLRNDENRGFAAACNEGARHSDADYLLFLNPDTRVEPDAIPSAIDFLQLPENAQTAVCGAQLVDETGTVSRTCARRPDPRHFAVQMLGLNRIAPRRFQSHVLESWNHAETRRVDHVMGAFYLIRRADFEQFGGFDERFFVYLEDLDLSVRLRDAGREIVYLTTARAFHKGGGSSEKVKAARLFYSLFSRIRYGYKHFPPVAATFLLVGTLLMEPPIRILVALVQGSGTDAWNTVRGITRLWLSLPLLRRSSQTVL